MTLLNDEDHSRVHEEHTAPEIGTRINSGERGKYKANQRESSDEGFIATRHISGIWYTRLITLINPVQSQAPIIGYCTRTPELYNAACAGEQL